eukprot:746259-Pyramimonas_sp.AAC.1
MNEESGPAPAAKPGARGSASAGAAGAGAPALCRLSRPAWRRACSTDSASNLLLSTSLRRDLVGFRRLDCTGAPLEPHLLACFARVTIPRRPLALELEQGLLQGLELTGGGLCLGSLSRGSRQPLPAAVGLRARGRLGWRGHGGGTGHARAIRGRCLRRGWVVPTALLRDPVNEVELAVVWVAPAFPARRKRRRAQGRRPWGGGAWAPGGGRRNRCRGARGLRRVLLWRRRRRRRWRRRRRRRRAGVTSGLRGARRQSVSRGRRPRLARHTRDAEVTRGRGRRDELPQRDGEPARAGRATTANLAQRLAAGQRG